MYLIDSFEICGFWGTKKLNSKLEDNVNIFIGRNGTGKTTLIKILHATLVVDLPMLAKLDFASIKLKLKKGSSILTITATKTETDIYYGDIKYKIGRNTFELPLLPKDVEYKRRLPTKVIEQIKDVRKRLSNTINVSWLSVYRELFDDDEYRDRFQADRSQGYSNPVDKRIVELMSKFTAYKLQLQSQYTKLSSDFQKKVLVSMLYSDTFDTFGTISNFEYNLNELKDKLTRAYQTLGVKDINSRIEEHISKLDNTITILSKSSDNNQYYINDILPLSLYRRTRHVVELSHQLDEDRQRLFEPIETFVNILQYFFSDKSFNFGISASGTTSLTKNSQHVDLESLSSGEKQLLILLTESLLQKDKRFIFIADEPELSLHIEWQRELFSAIKTLNKNAQIIVATHSPEIAGRWRNNVIRMEGIVSE